MKYKGEKINKDLKQYIEESIFPLYDRFYSHGMIHINSVINNMMMLSDYYKLNKNMSYVIASYHDLGLKINREKHEIESGKILYNDAKLKEFFNDDEIKTMKEAVEDHRGSKKTRPRSIYGECVSDSDRDFDIGILAKRQLATAIKNYPELTEFEDQFERCYEYICKRINSTGNFNLWTNNPLLIKQRDEFQKKYLDIKYTKSVYKKEWDRISNDGTIEKIKTYYEDY